MQALTRRLSGEPQLFWLLLGLHLVPLWSYRYWLTSDGPSHLYNAWLYFDLLRHPQQLAHELLSFNHNPEPNYLSHLLLGAGLLVAPPWLAEKLLLTLYVVSLPLALRQLLLTLRPDNGWLAILGFPLVYSTLLFWGFYNFCFSLVLLVWAASYWLRHAGSGWSLHTWLGLTLRLGLLYLAHPLTYLVSGLLLGLLALAGAAPPRPVANRPRQLAVLLLAYAPTLLPLGWYFYNKGFAPHSPVLNDYGANLYEWLTLAPLRYGGPAETALCGLLAALLLAGAAVAARQAARRPRPLALLPWALVVVLLAGAYVAAPNELAGGSVIRPRWGILSYLLLLAGLGTVPWPRPLRRAGMLAGTGLASILLASHWLQARALQPWLAEYRSVLPYLRPHTTLLALTYYDLNQDAQGEVTGNKMPVFQHVSGYLGVERKLLCYDNYEAETGYFPLMWRTGKAPVWMLGSHPPQLLPAAYQPAYVPHYVLLWGRTVAVPSNPGQSLANAAQVVSYLRQFRYRLRYRSPAGLLELYELPGRPAPQ